MIWNPWGLFGLVVLLVCTAMAIFIFTARPDRVQNRRLALLVFTEGLITAASPAGAAFAGSDATAGLFFIIHSAALVLVLPVMCRFLRTIDAPLAKPLTTRAGRMIPWLIAAAEGALFVARPGLFIAGFSKPWWGGRTFEVRPAMNAAYAFSGLVSIFSLLVAISGYRHAAPGTMAQDRARRYAIAFGFNDALTMIVTTIVPGVYGATHGGDLHPIEFVFVWAIPIVETIWVLLMTYGILRTQLFDIDLHLATGVRRGAIAAIVLFAFFAAAEIAKTVLSQDFGYIVGALAAAALLLIHKPVERFAASLSSTVLPGVTSSPAYLAFRKLEVYADALEAAYEDGRISKKDRVILDRLCAKLEVDPEDAARLEHDVRVVRDRGQHKRGKRANVS